MTAFLEKHVLIHGKYTTYRLRPNPDAPIYGDFREGGVLEWRDNDRLEEPWNDYFFMDYESMKCLRDALNDILGDE